MFTTNNNHVLYIVSYSTLDSISMRVLSDTLTTCSYYLALHRKLDETIAESNKLSSIILSQRSAFVSFPDRRQRLKVRKLLSLDAGRNAADNLYEYCVTSG